MWNRDRVIIHDAENRVLTDLIANSYPVANRTEVIANVNLARGLNAGEHRFHALEYTRRTLLLDTQRCVFIYLEPLRGAASAALTALTKRFT